MRLRASILGGGSWGTTVASLVARNVPTMIWARSAETVDEINTSRTNARYLPGARLTQGLRATTSIEEAVREADVVVLGVPSQSMRETLREVAKHVRAWVPLISLSKGFEQGTKLRMTEVIAEELPGHPAGVLTGPNLAREIMGGFAAASVIAMEDEVIVRELQGIFKIGRVSRLHEFGRRGLRAWRRVEERDGDRGRHGRRDRRGREHALGRHHARACRGDAAWRCDGRAAGDVSPA